MQGFSSQAYLGVLLAAEEFKAFGLFLAVVLFSSVQAVFSLDGRFGRVQVLGHLEDFSPVDLFTVLSMGSLVALVAEVLHTVAAGDS